MNYRDSLDITQLKLNNFVAELLWATTTFLLASYLTFVFVAQVNYQQLAFLDEKYFPLSFFLVKTIFWTILFLSTYPFINFIISFLKRGVDYEFNLGDWPRKWIHHGGITISTQPIGLEIKHSASGCLYQENLWKDFVLSFEAKFLTDENKLHHRSLGIILRALNLESYYMFELQADKGNGGLYVKPHVRLFGKWEFVDWTKVDTIKFDNSLRIRLKVKGRLVKFYLNNSLRYEWILPDRIDFRVETQPDPKKIEEKDDKKTGLTVKPVPFIENYGMVGFRADWGQGAVVSDLKVKTLSELDRIFLSIFRFKF